MNEYDSAKMLDMLSIKEDFIQTNNQEEADLLVLNTCSIREKAQERVFHQIGRWKKLKDNNPNLKIAIGGCVASQEGESLSKRAPAVDIVFGPQTLHRLPSMYKNAVQEDKRQLDISFPKIEKFDHIPDTKTDEPTAFVSIAEGCNKYCSFCVVPHTRGHEVSRPVNDIIEKTSEIDGIDRIRYTTSHPYEFRDDLVDLYAGLPELVSHVHLPVQSGSNRILKLMRRRYTSEFYLELIDRIRKNRPNISFSSDFIVGFPGETEKDFQDTLDIIDAVGYDESFSFIYSARPNTPAAEMEDNVSQTEKKERLSVLQHKLNDYSSKIGRKMIGSTERCLVTGISKKNPGEMQARTENNRVVNFASTEALIGNFADIEIVDQLTNCLRGTLVNA